jgi:hypothetical protein
VTTATTAELLARRVAQLESDRDHWERCYRAERNASRIRAICISWLMGNAEDAHMKALALDEESLDIVAHQCNDEVFRELRERGVEPRAAED